MGRLNRNWGRKPLPMKHKLPRKPKDLFRLKKLGLAFLITAIAVFVYIKVQPHTQAAKQERQLESKSQQLKNTIKTLEKQKTQDQKTQEQLKQTQQQLQDTQKQLESKRNAQTAYAAELSQIPAQTVPPAPTTNCGSDAYMAYIYEHESGCRTNAVNASSGAYGICQALPGSKMASEGADWQTNWDTQNRWCVKYAYARYGSPYLAYVYWINNHLW